MAVWNQKDLYGKNRPCRIVMLQCFSLQILVNLYIKEVNCTSDSKMSATTSKPAARIVSPVSTRSTEEKKSDQIYSTVIGSENIIWTSKIFSHACKYIFFPLNKWTRLKYGKKRCIRNQCCLDQSIAEDQNLEKCDISAGQRMNEAENIIVTQEWK